MEFWTHPGENGRRAHLSGKVAAALKARASELLAKPPGIEKFDVIAAKLKIPVSRKLDN